MDAEALLKEHPLRERLDRSFGDWRVSALARWNIHSPARDEWLNFDAIERRAAQPGVATLSLKGGKALPRPGWPKLTKRQVFASALHDAGGAHAP